MDKLEILRAVLYDSEEGKYHTFKDKRFTYDLINRFKETTHETSIFMLFVSEDLKKNKDFILELIDNNDKELDKLEILRAVLYDSEEGKYHPFKDKRFTYDLINRFKETTHKKDVLKLFVSENLKKNKDFILELINNKDKESDKMNILRAVLYDWKEKKCHTFNDKIFIYDLINGFKETTHKRETIKK